MSKNEHIITDYVHKLIKTLEGSNSTIGLPIPIDSIDWILRQVRTLFLKEPMMIAAEAPMKIVGDIHGQYKDLLNIFKRLVNPQFQIGICFSEIMLIVEVSLSRQYYCYFAIR